MHCYILHNQQGYSHQSGLEVDRLAVASGVVAAPGMVVVPGMIAAPEKEAAPGMVEGRTPCLRGYREEGHQNQTWVHTGR